GCRRTWAKAERPPVAGRTALGQFSFSFRAHATIGVATVHPSVSNVSAPPTSSTSVVSAITKLSTAELMEEAAETSRHLAALAGRIVLLAAELDRREGWR